MSFDIISIISLIAFLANFALGLIVLFRNPKITLNRYFGAMVLFIVAWLVANFFADMATNYDFALIMARVTNVAATWAAYFFVLFCLKMAHSSNRKIQRISNLPFYLVPLLLNIFVIFGLVIKDVFFEAGVYGIQNGSLIYVQISYYIVTLLLGVLILVFSYIKAKGIIKQQLKYMLFGLSIFTLGSLSFSVVIPTLTLNYSTFRLAPLTTVAFIAFTSYAIVKHRLMDIRLVVARSLAYTLLVIILAGGYAAAIFGAQKLFFEGTAISSAQTAIQIFLAMVMAFTFQPLRKYLTRATDKIFFKQQYDQDTFLKEINKILSTNIVLTELLFKTLDHTLRQMKIEEGMFVTVEEDKIHTAQSIGYKKLPTVSYPDVKYLSRQPMLVFDELAEGSRTKSILRKYEASVVVPLFEDRQFAGILVLGEKKSGDMFSAKDLQVLEIIIPEITMAMQRAKQYEEIQKFNLTLRTEIIRKTRKLREANEHLKELDHAKDEFISMASHQLRTPLTAIKGYLSMLLEGDAGEVKISQYDFINEAFQGSNKMVALINDLLNVSRMSTGKFFIDIKALDLKAMILDEVKQLTHQARMKGLYLKVEMPKAIPKVEADENKIRQVMMNFIDNAIYYTEKGGITVKAMHNRHDFVFEVHDTGIGVPKEVQAKLFSKFFRADNAKHLRPDGNGLGLYLAKRVAEDHGGEIVFRSSSKGSVFGFRIPIKSKINADEEKNKFVVVR